MVLKVKKILLHRIDKLNYQDLSRSPIISGIMNAGIAQLVEHNLAKVGVASSSLVSRSIKDVIITWLEGYLSLSAVLLGWVAEWLCSGLQSRGRRFDSDLRLQKASWKCPGGEIGRRNGLKIRWTQVRAGSSPALGTTFEDDISDFNVNPSFRNIVFFKCETIWLEAVTECQFRFFCTRFFSRRGWERCIS